MPSEQIRYENQDLQEQDWEDQELCGAVFSDCRFYGAAMSGLFTKGCQFINCDFSFAQLSGSRHVRSAFLNCRFHGTSLFSASFEECKGTGSNFTGADLTGLTLTGGNFSFSIW